MLATLVLALSAAPAFAHTATLHTKMASGSSTSSRQSGGCSITAGSHDSLAVSCQGRGKATLVYTFSSGRHPVHGQPMGWPYAVGWAHVDASTTATGHTIHLTITVSHGTVTISSVSVSYYA